jgi:hypothetical protein
MVGIVVMAMDLISDNVMSEHVQLTEDGAIMVHGVSVPNLVVMESNQDVDLVMNLVQLMVARNVLVMNLKRNHVIPMLHAQLMDNGVNSAIGVNVQNRVVMERNQE